MHAFRVHCAAMSIERLAPDFAGLDAEATRRVFEPALASAPPAPARRDTDASGPAADGAARSRAADNTRPVRARDARRAIDELLNDWLPHAGLDADARENVRGVLEDERGLLDEVMLRCMPDGGS
jgi:hypothetical protein